MRALVRAALAGAGYAVEEARDGTEALARLAGPLPDAIISDLDMPRMNGAAFVRACRADPHTAGIPIVLLSGRGAIGAMARELSVGASMGKPFSPAELVRLVGGLVQGRTDSPGT